MPTVAPTRRARLRALTLAEIKQHALDQITQDGAAALSLNGIAREMGMSGPAIYRYFASRDDLLAVLVADAWNDLADALETAAAGARRRTPPGRLRAVADAYREWAVAHPHRYRLALATPYGSGKLAPQDTIPAAHRCMLVILDVVVELGPLVDPRPGAIRALDAQLNRWAASREGGDELAPVTLELAVLLWTRAHGLVSLELEGVFDSMGLDPALLFRAEIDHLLAQHLELNRADG